MITDFAGDGFVVFLKKKIYAYISRTKDIISVLVSRWFQ